MGGRTGGGGLGGHKLPCHYLPHCPNLLLLLLRRRSGLPGRRRERQSRSRRRRGRGGDFPHHLLSSPPTNPQSQSAVQVTGGHMVGASPACYARKIIGPMPLRADSCIFPCRPMSNVHHHMLGQNKYLAMNVLQSIHRLKDVPSICHRQLKCNRL